jgi:protein gp37
MAASSAIEWTESTWNPVTGCTKVSDGCLNCYAERMALRLKAMGQANYVNGFRVTLHESMLELPLKWRTPQTIFVNSMSDLFHEGVPLEFIQQVFETMRRADWHRFQILTKRADRLAEIGPELNWPKHVWMGVTVENRQATKRIEALRIVPARNRFLSMEPLLGHPGDLDLRNIDWVIVGGESGPRARPMQQEWAESVHRQCIVNGIPFFFKQWGGVRKKAAGRELNGRIWDEMPSNLLIA